MKTLLAQIEGLRLDLIDDRNELEPRAKKRFWIFG
jgi:hypothetical protein